MTAETAEVPPRKVLQLNIMKGVVAFEREECSTAGYFFSRFIFSSGEANPSHDPGDHARVPSHGTPLILNCLCSPTISFTPDTDNGRHA